MPCPRFGGRWNTATPYDVRIRPCISRGRASGGGMPRVIARQFQTASRDTPLAPHGCRQNVGRTSGAGRSFQSIRANRERGKRKRTGPKGQGVLPKPPVVSRLKNKEPACGRRGGSAERRGTDCPPGGIPPSRPPATGERCVTFFVTVLRGGVRATSGDSIRCVFVAGRRLRTYSCDSQFETRNWLSVKKLNVFCWAGRVLESIHTYKYQCSAAGAWGGHQNCYSNT